jgi:putative peptide maturation system protein
MPLVSDVFERAVASGISLLRVLPRERGSIGEARSRFADFANAHASLRAELAVDLEPGRDLAAYDMLLGHPDGGTVALSWRPDHASPWLADYAEHWAANYVVSVGDAHLTVQDALTSLRISGREDAGLLDRLVEETITRKAVVDRGVDCTPEEAQDALDSVRRSLGLHTAAATHAWLRTVGWSEHEFASLVAGGLRVRKVRDVIVGDGVDAHFAAHRARFDIVRVCTVETWDRALARRLAEDATAADLLAATERLSEGEADRVDVRVRSIRARELPAELRDLPAGVTAELSRPGDRFQVAQLLSRRAATLDAATRAAVGDALFGEWLDDQRKSAEVRWHWL